MWKWSKFVIVLIILRVASGKDLNRQEDSLEDEGISEIDRQGWRALKAFQEDDSLWKPYARLQESSEVPVQKRRRLRKRKRKPTPSSLTEEDLSESYSERNVPIRRRPLPQKLDDTVEPWREMAEEAIIKPNKRRRITPTYQPLKEIDITFEEETTESSSPEFEYPKEALDKSETHRTTIPDLKAVLKQSGTGSLSEILQQKNLSLSELLMGNRRAISALTETPQEVSPTPADAKTTIEVDTTKYRRVPPSIGLRKDVNRNYEQEGESMERLSSKEMLEAQRKRLSLLSHKDNKLFPTVTKYDVVTEPTTERRIFVPSHPKYYTSIVYKPEFTIYERPTEPVPETTEKESFTTTTSTTTPKPVKTTTVLLMKPKLKNLPITHAKINKITTKATFKVEEKEMENYPLAFNFPKPVPIKIQDVAGFKQHFEIESEVNSDKKPFKMPVELPTNAESNNNKEQLGAFPASDDNKGPLKMSIDLEVVTEESSSKIGIQPVTTPKNVKSVIEETPEEKIVPATAKDEILEIIRDPVSRERLSRILENRNMTLKELVELRERGSSQLHLADIFHNKTREPEPEGEPFIGTVSSEYFDSFPLFGRQPKSRTFEEKTSNELSPVSNPTPTVSGPKIDIKATTEPNIAATNFPAVKIGLENTEDQDRTFLSPNEYGTNLLLQFSQSSIEKANGNVKDYGDSSDRLMEDELQRLANIDPTLSFASKENLNGYQQEDEVLINIPSGVKSAIFVSLSIICLSIIVFLTILLVFKWTQRQTKKINYCNSLSSKIKSPMIIQRRPTNAIKSFMTETLGRKKNYYKSNQSTDDLWECGRERIPSF